MDLHYSQTAAAVGHSKDRFTTLWIYTILKHADGAGIRRQRFTTLWIYTILKQLI